MKWLEKISAERRWGFALIVVASVMLGGLAKQYSHKTNYNDYWAPIVWDGAGYYAYLPGTFIHPYMSRDMLSESMFVSIKSAIEQQGPNEALVKTKYPVGVAWLYAGPYATVHLLRQAQGHTEDSGFESIYQNAIWLTTILYSVIGLVFLYLWLIQHVQPVYAFAATLAVYFGTSTYFYAVYRPAYAHAAGFAVLGVYLLCVHLFYHSGRYRFLLFSLGLLVFLMLIRPTNALFSLVLFLYPSISHKPGQALLHGLRQLHFRWLPSIGLIVVCLVLIAPQLYYWYTLSGDWVYYSYEKEGFNFLSPELSKFLFSPLNGLFAYHPLWFLLFGAMIYLYWGRARYLPALGLTFMVLLWVNASWWNWWYGGSFGQRSMSEAAILMVLPLGLLLQKSHRVVRLCLLAFALVCVYKNIQYGLSDPYIPDTSEADAYEAWKTLWVPAW